MTPSRAGSRVVVEWADRAVDATRSTTSGGAMNAVNRPDVLARFWSKVNRAGDCWLWVASLGPNGYGQFNAGSSIVRAHRFAYEAAVGPVPAGLELDHLCRVRRCVNPAHLEPVTHRDNIMRGDTIVAGQVKRGRCPIGHEYAGENLIVRQGSRFCRECKRKSDRDYRARKRLQVPPST